MELDRRRLWLALVSVTAFIAERSTMELRLSQGYLPTHFLDDIAVWRMGVMLAALVVLGLIIRDLAWNKRDWPMERVVAVGASIGLLFDVIGLMIAPAFSVVAAFGWIAHLAGMAIWLPELGRKP